tara:strand:+ start:235 stop:1692 length:1458 start_codon:yes stop_codon:yes gene_type:complete
LSIVKKIATISIGQGINTLANFLFLPYMARALDYSSYGSYGQVILIVSFVGAILTFGLPKILYVYLNEKKRYEKTVLSSNLFAALTLGVAGLFFLLFTGSFFSHWLGNGYIENLIYIYSFSLLFSIPYQSINSYFIFTNRVKTSVVLILFTNLVKVILVVMAIQFYSSVYLALIGILISQLLQFILGVYLIRKSIDFNLDKDLIFEQVKKGFPLGLTGLLGTAILYTDSLMVSRFNGVESYAIYRNGAIEVPFIATIYGAISTIVLPEITKLYSKREFKEIINLKKKVIMNTMMLTYPVLIFLIFNSSDLIVAYLGSKYEASSIIFLVFNFTLLIRVNDYGDILIAANKGKTMLYFYLIALSVNIVLNYFLIQWIGGVGAAISTVLSVFLLAFLQLNKSLLIIKSKITELILFRNFMLLILSSLILAFSINFVVSYFLEPQLKLIVFFLTFFPIIYFFLFKRGLFSREIIYRLLPLKIANWLNNI